jgi:RNA polymerase sigma-70 factor (ECF subfamily)
MMYNPLDTSGGRGQDFRTTRWSVVTLAGQVQSVEAQAALEQLCRAYWRPLYTFVRRQGYGPVEAQDLTQEFFSTLLERKALQQVRQERGRFRNFLLSSLKNFLANEWDKRRAQKRGGNRIIFSLEEMEAEERYRVEPTDEATPDKMFERRWAQSIFERVMRRLREEYESTGKTDRFEALKPLLTTEGQPATYAQIGRGLGLTENAVRSALSRLRQRSRELFRSEIAHTVAGPEEIDDEIRYLFTALSS